MTDQAQIYLSLFKDKYYSYLDLIPKQLSALEILTDDINKLLVFGGGAGGGKSWLGSTWILLTCLLYPDVKAFIGREELKRITESTLLTFYKVCKYYGVKINEDVHYNAKYNYLYFNNGSRIDLLELKNQPSDPLYERFGSLEYTIGWIEEGGEVDEGAFDVLNTRIGRHLNDKYNLLPKLLVTCNPKQNWLYTRFYKPSTDNKLSGSHKFIQSLIIDNPKIESNYLEQLSNVNDEAQKQRLLYGNWDYESISNQLVTHQWLQSILTDEYPNINKKLGVDIAREGKDKTICAQWANNVLIDLYKVSVEISDQANISGLIKDDIKRYMIQNQIGYGETSLDAIGVGAGVLDAFRGDKWFVKSYKAGEKVEIKNLVNQNQFEDYFNLRCYSYWQFRIKCQNKEIKINKNIPYLEELFRDLTAHTYQTTEKVIKIEDKDEIKKKIGRSPDFSDASVIGLFPQPIKEFGFAFS